MNRRPSNRPARHRTVLVLAFRWRILDRPLHDPLQELDYWPLAAETLAFFIGLDGGCCRPVPAPRFHAHHQRGPRRSLGQYAARSRS